MISCCTSADRSQLLSRSPFSTSGSHWVAFGLFFPKFELLIPPHSPLASKLPRLQSGT